MTDGGVPAQLPSARPLTADVVAAPSTGSPGAAVMAKLATDEAPPLFDTARKAVDGNARSEAETLVRSCVGET